MMNKYQHLASKFKPKEIKYLFIGESPPVTKKGKKEKDLKYFYNYKRKDSSTLLRNIYYSKTNKKIPSDKIRKPFLLELRDKNTFLIDAVQVPINNLSNKERKILIKKKYPILKKNIKKLHLTKKVKIYLIQNNVIKAIGDDLTKDFGEGKIVKIGFPRSNIPIRYDKKFIQKIQKT